MLGLWLGDTGGSYKYWLTSQPKAWFFSPSPTNFPMASQFFTKIESRFVTSADGTQILADAIGNRSPEFPVIVMIHGFCMIGAAFDPMFDDPQWTSNAFLVCSSTIKFDLY